MKIKHLLLLLLLAFCAPRIMYAQTPTNVREYFELTINENASIGIYYVPFYDSYVNYGTHSQFIIPAEDLSEMTQGVVDRLTFYCQSQTRDWGEAQFSVYVAEVGYTEFSVAGLVDWDMLEQVYNGSLSVADSVMVIELQEPFVYAGGNLMIGFRETQNGTRPTNATKWYGVSVSNNCLVYACKRTPQGYLYSYLTQYLPKLTFGYQPSPYLGLNSITIDGITSTTAAFSWTAPSDDVTGYAYQYKYASSIEWPTDWVTTTDNFAELQGLDPLTEYSFRVKVLYGEHQSGEKKIEFTTECAEYYDVPFAENFDSYAVSSSYPAQAAHVLPDCWDYINTSSSSANMNYPTLHYHSFFNYSYSHPNCLLFNIYNLNATYDAQPQYAILPRMQDIDGLRVSFKAKIQDQENYFVSTFKVGVMQDTDASSFVEVATITPTSASYTTYSFDLDGYGEAGNRIAFMMEVPNSMHSGRVFIDDIFVESVSQFILPIAAHGYTGGGWHLISSPMAGVTNAENVRQLSTPEFNFYRFNPNNPVNQELIWENWKQVGDHYHFDMESGRGYLYSNSVDVNLGFVGTPYDGDGVVTLHYVEGARFGGWNLVGNPFPETAYIGNRDYYRMNDEGSGFVPATTGSPIGVMEGIFVYTETDGEIITFSTTQTPNRGEQLTVNVSKTTRDGLNTAIDRAILRFGEGHQLPKFQFNEESAKLYIPQNGMDYAIVAAEGQGEMPVNFRADEDGTYTLSLSIENVEFSYLHLFDNKTGNDIDLLAPEHAEGLVTYTFNATTTDYESRFKLVYATGSSVDGDSFTFLNSNGNFSIFGIEGEATLQVLDVMGRMLSTESFNGSIDKHLDVAPGVYFIRLLSGDDVKTQKIVVR